MTWLALCPAGIPAARGQELARPEEREGGETGTKDVRVARGGARPHDTGSSRVEGLNSDPIRYSRDKRDGGRPLLDQRRDLVLDLLCGCETIEHDTLLDPSLCRRAK